jgi:PKHD-type hydroxylase
MYWLYPQKKQADTLFVAYDAKDSNNFCPPGQNWGAFTDEECDRVLSLSKSEKSIRLPKDKMEAIARDYHQAEMWSINYSEQTKWLWEKVVTNLTSVNERWWGFDVYGIIEPLRLLCYDGTNAKEGESDRYEPHIDNAHPFSCRKISFALELSAPNIYEGGRLKVHAASRPIEFPNSRGTIIMFPSFFLSEIEPIITGKKWVLVGWISGPQLR